MPHHKRGRAKRRRAGCLWCKPHKGNGVGRAAEHHTTQRAATVSDELHEFSVAGTKLRAPDDHDLCRCLDGPDPRIVLPD